jgi:hypothetical protein
MEQLNNEGSEQEAYEDNITLKSLNLVIRNVCPKDNSLSLLKKVGDKYHPISPLRRNSDKSFFDEDNQVRIK